MSRSEFEDKVINAIFSKLDIDEIKKAIFEKVTNDPKILNSFRDQYMVSHHQMMGYNLVGEISKRIVSKISDEIIEVSRDKILNSIDMKSITNSVHFEVAKKLLETK